MRTLVFVAAILVGCQQRKEAAPAVAPPPPAKPDAAMMVAVDAPAIDATAPDDADHTFDLYNRESIGPLKPGIDEKVVISVLGKPRSKTKAMVEGATGDTVSTWTWPHASISMARGDNGWVARSISITGPATLETKEHIHIGSTRAELEKAYIRSPDDEGKKTGYLAGSVYGGLLFELDHDRVTSISLGAFAF